MSGELSCVIVASLVLIGLVIVVVMGRRMVKDRNMESKGDRDNFLGLIADEIGMAVDNNGRIAGEYHGRKVTIKSEKVDIAELATFAGAALMDSAAASRHSSDQPGIAMRVTAELEKSQRSYFGLSPGESKAPFEKLFVKGVKTGYQDLDGRYSVESSPKDFARHVFGSQDLREQITNFIVNKSDSLVVNKAKLLLQYRASNLDQEHVRSMLNFITMISDASEAYQE